MKQDVRALVNIDRLIHEPARLVIMATLYFVEAADFVYLRRETGMTAGNLSSHLAKLEAGGYVEIEKTYREKTPRTICRLSNAGREAFRQYRALLKAASSMMDG